MVDKVNAIITYTLSICVDIMNILYLHSEMEMKLGHICMCERERVSERVNRRGREREEVEGRDGERKGVGVAGHVLSCSLLLLSANLSVLYHRSFPLSFEMASLP